MLSSTGSRKSPRTWAHTGTVLRSNMLQTTAYGKGLPEQQSNCPNIAAVILIKIARSFAGIYGSAPDPVMRLLWCLLDVVLSQLCDAAHHDCNPRHQQQREAPSLCWQRNLSCTSYWHGEGNCIALNLGAFLTIWKQLCSHNKSLSVLRILFI